MSPMMSIVRYLNAEPPTAEELMAGNLAYLREKYAIGFINDEELEEGLDSVLRGGPINVPKAKGTMP